MGAANYQRLSKSTNVRTSRGDWIDIPAGAIVQFLDPYNLPAGHIWKEHPEESSYQIFWTGAGLCLIPKDIIDWQPASTGYR